MHLLMLFYKYYTQKVGIFFNWLRRMQGQWGGSLTPMLTGDSGLHSIPQRRGKGGHWRRVNYHGLKPVASYGIGRVRSSRFAKYEQNRANFVAGRECIA